MVSDNMLVNVVVPRIIITDRQDETLRPSSFLMGRALRNGRRVACR